MERWAVSISSNALRECLEFACLVAPHVYPRLAQSRQSFSTHIARTFFGKVGEAAFATVMRNAQWPNADQVYATMFSVFPGTTAVDHADILCQGFRLDVKTVFHPYQHYLIIPADQWRHQPKDFYVLVRTHYPDLFPQKTLMAYLDQQAALFPAIQQTGAAISALVRQGRRPSDLVLHDLNLTLRQIFHETPIPWRDPIRATLVGFLPSHNPQWIHVLHDGICPEGPCVRCRDTALLSMDRLATHLAIPVVS